MLSELRSRGQRLDATVHVSSPELKESIIVELANQLKKRELVKVKLLKECTERDAREDIAKRLAEATGAVLVEVRGNTLILYKERKR